MGVFGTEKDVLVRRLMHCLIALAPLYFLIPDDLPVPNVRRWVLLIVFFAAVSIFDTWRRLNKVPIFGLRPHEQEGIASFAWAAAGITFVLWLIPKPLATATLISMAFVDPLAGELRRVYGKKIWVHAASIAVYFALAFSTLALWGDHAITSCVIIALIGALVAIPSEAIKMKVLDDDFLMLVVPGVAMGVAAQLL
jgi:dolichol kinase